jgi:hypothetical protein
VPFFIADPAGQGRPALALLCTATNISPENGLWPCISSLYFGIQRTF